eukprot:Hpha_TRINITY_DN16900_c3_g2::TRINITY_DN16900_c3_g2_i3::g.55116::m.55116/K02218/CSNK1, CKI; casein kinase 1
MVAGFVGPFRVGKKLGAGSSAAVFAGIDTRDGRPVAIKLLAQEDETLPVEVEVLRRLDRKQGFARLHWHGDTPDGERAALVTDLLGSSLGDLMYKRGRPLEVAAAMHIGLQLLHNIEELHGQSFVHRDIKPDNCLLGRGADCGKVFLIDFGLSKTYVDEGTHSHVKYADHVGFSGTPDFSSVRSHHGVRQTRRDDLESFCYVLLYLLKGHLPWMGMTADTEDELMSRVARLKDQITVDQLCSGCPTELRECLSYTRSIPYDATPNYAKLRSLLTAALKRAGGDPNSSLRITGICPPPVMRSKF